jgi:hypothetical protein
MDFWNVFVILFSLTLLIVLALRGLSIIIIAPIAIL